MKRILAFASASEALTGIALLALPSAVARLLFGLDLVGAGVAAARVAGIALVALGVACWPMHGSRGAALGMLIYTLLVAVYFAAIGARGEMIGVLLWPVAVYHALLAAVLGISLVRPQPRAH